MIINGIVLARQLTPGGYGAFGGTFVTVGLIGTVFRWGLDTWLLSQGILTDNLPKLVAAAWGINTIAAVTWGVLLLFVLPALSPNVYLVPLVLVSLVDTWSENLFVIQLSALNVLKRLHLVSLLLLILYGGRLFGTLILTLLDITSPLLFAQARLLATFISLTLAFVTFRPRFTGGLVDVFVHILHQSLPFALSDLLTSIYLRVGIILLAVIVGQSEAVGHFSVAYGLLTALFVIPSAGYYVMVPEVARLNSKDKLQLGRTAKGMFTGFIILGIALWLGLWFTGRFLIEPILGSAYHTASELLSALSPILFLKSLGFAGVTVLVAVGWQRYRVVVQVISVLVNVLASLWFIMHSGVFGLASASLITEVILMLGYVGLTIRWLRIASISVWR